MSFQDLKNIAAGWIKDWNKGKLKKKCQELAQEALDGRIENAELKDQNRQLQDEIRKLKGEKAKPKIKKISTSDLNPKNKKKHQKKKKNELLEIDEEIEVKYEGHLPEDATRVGERSVIIQEIKFSRRNIKFMLERYYSKSEGKVYEGELPEEFRGREFGPKLRSFILYQYYKNRVPHRKIQEMLSDIGLEISKGTICSILNNLPDEYGEELEGAKKAALKKCSYIHIDETSARFKGVNAYTFGVSNRYFTEFVTALRKNKKVAKKALGRGSRGSPIRFLISDDAPNFKGLIKNHQLCWVHEIRKYKLNEVFKRVDFETLDLVIKEWRKLYGLMKQYVSGPSLELKNLIKSEFERITTAKTCVKPIDEQLLRTAKNKDKLLLFLRYPQLPLHNNQAELDIRERVIKRKISLQNRSKEGMKAWDVMLSLCSTCRKLNISFWEYLEDRVSLREELPYLGQVIKNMS